MSASIVFWEISSSVLLSTKISIFCLILALNLAPVAANIVSKQILFHLDQDEMRFFQYVFVHLHLSEDRWSLAPCRVDDQNPLALESK